MAKLGEGDPRWIVQERADGINVNNWHWVEKDCTQWAKSRITSFVTNQTIIDSPDLLVRTGDTETLSGEAHVNNRKGKRIVFYEIELKIKWNGCIKDGSGAKVVDGDGILEVANLSEENSADDLDVRVTCSGSTSGHDRLREVARVQAIPWLRDRLATFIREFQKGEGDCPAPAGPCRSSPSTASISPVPRTLKSAASEATSPVAAATPPPSRSTPSAPGSVSSRSFTQKVHFRAPPGDIYECLMDSNRVSAYTQSKAEISRDVGGAFSIFNGSLHGTNVVLDPGKRIVQKWRMRDWPAGHTSTVTIHLEPDASDQYACNLTLTQIDVPETDAQGHGGVVERTQQGWRMHFWEKIKLVFNYGMDVIGGL